MLGPYIKSRGIRGTKMSANAALKGKQFENFSYMSRNVIYFLFWAIQGALRGPSMIRLGLSCFSAILSSISMYMSNKETIG